MMTTTPARINYQSIFPVTIPRRLRSTLFPYTTLFRSFGGWIQRVQENQSGPAQNKSGTVAYPRQPCRIDRKSTRLNSSHGCISYAVCCLKKKKEHNTVGFPHRNDGPRWRTQQPVRLPP